MKHLKLDINKAAKNEINLIVDYLKGGKVIVYPTDTIYGLGCLANNRRALAKIRKIKQRDKDKPLLILVNCLAMLKKYCYLSQKQVNYLHSIWPGAVTVVLKSRGVLPAELSGGRETMAARLPNNKFLCTIIKRVGLPIIATSLNISGQKYLTSLENVEKYFKRNRPDLIVDAGKAKAAKPSKLLDLRDIDNIIILRN